MADTPEPENKIVDPRSVPDYLPPDFFARKDIVDPLSPEGIKATAYLKKISDRLLIGEGIDPATRPFRFFLSHDVRRNAYILPKLGSPIIVVNKGMFLSMEHEDEIASIMRHEIEHYNLNNYDNSKVQEALCDGASVNSLRSADYNPLALVSAFKRMHVQHEKDWDDYIDVHPDMANRIRDIESLATVKDRKEGDVSADWTPIDPELKTMLAAMPQPLGAMHEWLNARGYGEATEARRIELLDQFLLEELKQEDPFAEPKNRNFADYVRRLQIDTADPAQKAALDDLVDHILAGNGTIKGFYTSLPGSEKPKVRFQFSDKQIVPLGRLADLDQAVGQFLAATVAEEAEKHASTINAIAARYYFRVDDPSSYKFSFDAIESAVSAYERSMNFDRSWRPHVEWSKTSPTDNIRRALQRIGFGEDADMPQKNPQEEKPVEPIFEHNEKFLASLRIRGKNYLATFNNREHLFLDEHDDNRPRSLKEERRRDAIEIRRMAAREAAEAALLPTIDWKELETDFSSFTAKYNEFLLPETTIVAKGGDAIAGEFLRRAKQLVDKDPERYRSELREFFTGVYRTHDSDLIGKMKAMQGPKSHWRSYSPAAGVSLSHPYVNFVLDDSYKLFDSSFKSMLASKTVFLKTKDPSVPLAQRLAIDPIRVFGEMPATFDDLPSAWHWKRDAYRNYIAASLLHDTLRDHPDAVLSVEDMHNMRCAGENLKNDLGQDARDMLARQIVRNTEHELRLGASAQEIADAYIVYCEDSSFLRDDALRARYENAIMERFDGHGDVDASEKMAQALLFRVNSENPLTSKIPNHHFRAWANQLMIASLKGRMGMDDGSEAYRQAVDNKMADIGTITRENPTLFEILPGWAEAINAQPETAFLMRDRHAKKMMAASALSTYVGAPVELSLDVFTKQDDIRFAAIDFLTSPFNREAALNFGGMADDALNEELRGKNSEWSFNDGPDRMVERYEQIHREFWQAPLEARAWYLDKLIFPTADMDNKKFEAAKTMVIDKAFVGRGTAAETNTQLTNLRRQQRAARAWQQELHFSRIEQDWLEKMDMARSDYPAELPKGSHIAAQYSLQMRKMLVDYYKLKAIHKGKEILAEFKQEGASFCDPIKAYLPGMRGFTSEANQVMRQIALSYLDSVGQREQRLALSAVMASRSMAYEDQRPGHKTSPGKFAAQVLGNLDEMGGKLLQAIDSHPGVPEDIKKDLGDAKGNYQKPKRWDALQWSLDHGIAAQGETDRVTYYGPVIGSGSMGYTLLVKTADGQEFADTLLRPHAQPRSEREASNMLCAAEKLVKTNAKLVAASDIAAVAQRDARIETHMALAYKQGLVAAQVYNGLATSATVNGKTYTFTHRTADITAYSEGGKRSVLVKGEHFKDLPEASAAQRDYKRAAAIQLYGTEVFNIATGKPCDRDRHGKNQKIEPGRFNHFDFGMTALALPTDEQKREMVKVLTAAFRDNILLRKDIASSFDRQIRKSHASIEVKHYLSGLRRQILSLGDFDKYLTLDDKKQILATVLRSPQFDPVIRDQLQATRFGRMFVDRIQATNGNLFHIDDKACAQNIQMPALTADEARLIHGEVPTSARNARKKSASRAHKTTTTGQGSRAQELMGLAQSHAAALRGLVKAARPQGTALASPTGLRPVSG